MNRTLIKNATIINEGRTFTGSVLIEDDKIAAVYEGTIPAESGDATVIDATGKYLLPGAIDDQVHFREPGLTHKGDIASESRAVANMQKNRCLAKSISDASWSEFVRQLEYKARWYGRTLIGIDRWYPSSKRCSDCGRMSGET